MWCCWIFPVRNSALLLTDEPSHDARLSGHSAQLCRTYFLPIKIFSCAIASRYPMTVQMMVLLFWQQPGIYDMLYR
jgi:hypothetical protein